MNQLYWDTCRKNAEAFVMDYLHVRDEKGEAHSFWDRFFEIFGLQRIRYANHEARVKREGNRQGFIDLLWKGKLLAEHKSASKDKPEDFADALRQAQEYVQGLPLNDRPRKLVVCNFKRFRVYDLTKKDADDTYIEVTLADLPKRLDVFDFFPEFAELSREEEEKANLEAVLRISNVYKTLYNSGYRGHDLELLLVRILFCVFAEDTGIFEPKQFSDFIEKHTLDNGSDIGQSLEDIFEALNTPPRLRKYDKEDPLRGFPYVNGGLFADKLTQTPPSLSGIRNAILGCGDLFDWSQISPEIFGSLFQAALEETERRSLGAHYTSEKNILRLLEPLFLNELREEFRNARRDRKKLESFRRKIAGLRFIDPACGCGNFLVVTYRELRLLDLEVSRILQGDQQVLDISMLENVHLDHFYGIEIKPVSALIAQVALWLTKHQCNRLLNQTFHTHLKSIPIDETPNIITGNALLTDWETLPKKEETFDYIVGNPPFSGAKIMDDAQREEIKTLFGNVSGSGTLDYVTGWYLKAAQYMAKHPNTRSAFVSTNSISQGEQVGMLWGTLLEQYGVRIHFAHQTFKWINEAPGVAAVFCIIVGFGQQKNIKKQLFEYADIKGEPTVSEVKNINPYLVEAGDIFLQKRRIPITKVSPIAFGSMPNDGGHLILSTEERDAFIKIEPKAQKWIKPLLSAHEFLNGKDRWCLWLPEISHDELKLLPEVNKKVLSVEEYRKASSRAATQKLSQTPHLFGENRQPKSNYILIPRHSSEQRPYIPMGFFPPSFIASDSCLSISDASLFLFGILTSTMHMAWVKYTCGRIKSDFRYSNEIVYNNFPFPVDATSEQEAVVEEKAQVVLDVRKKHQDTGLSLAKLYDPNTMPADLLKAHQALDKAVDACYGVKRVFSSEAKRVAFLFGLYEELVKK